ncbi:MAG: hypothetical protein ACRC7O_17035 [Fimbriiglobus sp.]
MCFIRQEGRLTDIQVSLPDPDSAWGERLAVVTLRVVARFRLTVQT